MKKSHRLKTGIFSGSFNPIHIGHLALANYLCEYGGLDEIWFMVTPQNPLKTQDELWSDELRLRLVELCISDYPHFRASDFEFHLPRPSYSVYTVSYTHLHYLADGVSSRVYLYRQVAQSFFQFGIFLFVGYHDNFRLKLPRLSYQQLHTIVGRQRVCLVQIGMFLYHLQCLCADRPGRA